MWQIWRELKFRFFQSVHNFRFKAGHSNANDFVLLRDNTKIFEIDSDGAFNIPSFSLEGTPLTSSAASINMLDNRFSQLAATIGAEASNIKNVALTFKDADGVVCASPAGAFCYLSDNSDGSTLTATAADTLAIGTNGVLIPLVTGKAFYLVSEATTGLADVDITYASGAKTWYLFVVAFNSTPWSSGAITFA
jgi:hypothetical protein